MSKNLPEWLGPSEDIVSELLTIAQDGRPMASKFREVVKREKRKNTLATLEQVDKMFEENDLPFWAITKELKKQLEELQ